MTEYIKIPNIFKRETFGKNKLLYGEYSSEELKYLSGCEWTWTEKVDGTNVRVLWDGYRVSFMGRTDRAQLPKDLEAKLMEFFGGTDKEELFEQTFGQKPVILFGEGYGGKIQGAGPQYGAVDFILFDVMVGSLIDGDICFDRDMYLMREAVEGIADVFGLKVVPIVGRGMTNADRIRTMSDEELARFMTREDLCELTCGSPIPCDGRCESMMLAWLKSPVAGGEQG